MRSATSERDSRFCPKIDDVHSVGDDEDESRLLSFSLGRLPTGRRFVRIGEDARHERSDRATSENCSRATHEVCAKPHRCLGENEATENFYEQSIPRPGTISLNHTFHQQEIKWRDTLVDWE